MIAVSVIIINYNTFQLTCQCIQSILNKTQGLNYEIILIDNASTECDPQLFKNKFRCINLLVSQTNTGFAGGNNLGIKHARGKYILLLNSDMVLLNNAVKLACETMERNPAFGVLSGQLQYENGDPQFVAGRFPSISRQLVELFRLSKSFSPEKRKSYYLGTEADYTKSFECDWVWGAFFMFRKDDLKHFPNGKLHDDFFMYYEDVQWCYHFKKQLKKKVCYSPEPQAVHFIGGSDRNNQDISEKYFTHMVPNQYRWMVGEKGWWYARTFYLLKALHLWSLRNSEDTKKAKRYFDLVMNGVGD
jgi:GT2 family glycosyltransferase